MTETSWSDAVFAAQKELILNQQTEIGVLRVANGALERNYDQATERVVALAKSKDSWREASKEVDEKLERVTRLLAEARDYLHHVRGPQGNHLDPCVGCVIEKGIDDELSETSSRA